MTIDEEILLIFLEKGLLAIVLVVVGFLFNWILQSARLRKEMANELAVDRAAAYKELWKKLASIRPGIGKKILPSDVEATEKVLVDWYHHEANALYMSWTTARQYMLARRWLNKKPINSRQIRRRISRLRTQLKIDCGIYSGIEGILPLPSRTAKGNHKATESS